MDGVETEFVKLGQWPDLNPLWGQFGVFNKTMSYYR